MCNDAIRIALTEKPRNRFDLITRAYQRLKEYGLHTHYVLNACEAAYSIYKNKNRRSDPYVTRAFLKLDNQSYRLDYLILRIPAQPRNFLFITLQGSNYHLSYLADKSLKRGSITITDSAVILSFSKETTEIEPLGQIGIDVNERNVTASDTLGNTKPYDTSQIAEIKERYKAVRAKLAQRTQLDKRAQQRLLSKYGRRERDRTVQRIHQITKQIVQRAEKNHLGIAMEKLKGIRKLYRKGNCQGPSFRGRMNSWTFHEIQRQIEYKAAWEGIPVTYVNPRGTSSKCQCGSSLIELKGRRLMCPSCKNLEDRDVFASKKIMAAALVPAARPDR